MLKVTDKELSTVKMCLGQTGTTIHGTCFICVNWGCAKTCGTGRGAGLSGRWGVPASALGRILYSSEGT